MTEGIKILVTVDEELAKWMDETLKEINEKKNSWQTNANRQALIRACIRYTMKHDPPFESHWSRDIYFVSDKQ